MPTTDNHNYNIPEKSSEDWHIPLNENFNAIEDDVEIRDTDAAKSNYTPTDGAKYLATDSGTIYQGDGSTWNPIGSIADSAADQPTASGDGSTTTFTLAHSLGSTPTAVDVTAASLDAAGDYYISGRSASNVDLTYTSAPPSGTENLSWDLITHE